jgi:hypothetical protein
MAEIKGGGLRPLHGKPSARLSQKTARQASPWPYWLQVVFQALHEVPWIGLTTVSALAGAAVLFTYFKSIGHVPSDLAALTSLAVSTSAAALVMLFATALFFSLPLIAARVYSSEHDSAARTPFSPTELLSAQAAGVGLLLVSAAYDTATECNAPLGPSFYIGTVIAMVGVARTVFVYAQKTLCGSRVTRLVHSSFIAVAAMAPLIALLPLRHLAAAEWLDPGLFMLSAWLLILTLNAAALHAQTPVMHGGIAAAALAVVLYVAVPLALNRSSDVSAFVAEAVGLKSEGTVTVLLSQKACLLMQAARAQASAAAAMTCDKSDGNAQEVAILSNVGSRWVLGLPTTGSQRSAAHVRITIPSDEINVMSHHSENAEKRKSCR